MIDITKVNICDNCNETDSAGKGTKCIYNIELERSGKKIHLCEKCTRELVQGLSKLLELEENHVK